VSLLILKPFIIASGLTDLPGWRFSFANSTLVHHRRSCWQRSTLTGHSPLKKKTSAGRTLQHQKRSCDWRVISPKWTWQCAYVPTRFLFKNMLRCRRLVTVGAPIAGRISDRILVAWREKRNGRLVPEDRLRAALPGALVLLPLSVLLSGVFTRYVAGTTGLVLNMVCLFVSGIGVRMGSTAGFFFFAD